MPMNPFSFLEFVGIFPLGNWGNLRGVRGGDDEGGCLATIMVILMVIATVWWLNKTDIRNDVPHRSNYTAIKSSESPTIPALPERNE